MRKAGNRSCSMSGMKKATSILGMVLITILTIDGNSYGHSPWKRQQQVKGSQPEVIS